MAPFTCNRRFRVGAADTELPGGRHPGTFNLVDGTVTTDNVWIGSGSHGEMNMSGGTVNTRENLYFDWTFDSGSVLNMTGGVFNIGGVMRMYRTSELNLEDGHILVAGPAELGTQTMLNPMFLQTPDVEVSITGGLLQSNGFLQIGGSIVIDGGILRAASFNEGVSAGTIEVNEGGILQFNNAQESVASVEGLISSGVITTTSPLGTAGFLIEVVDVNGTNFTQVAFPAVLGVTGDYNDNGTVDAADYVVWRNAGPTDTLPHDPTPGVVDASDYTAWKANFGKSAGSGAAFGDSAVVPEPSSLACGLMVLVSFGTMACGNIGRFRRNA
jgi:hypothetical protein